MEPFVVAAVVLLAVVGLQSFAYYLRWRNGRRDRERERENGGTPE